MARKFIAVTTTEAKGYAAYGKAMVESFHRHWPQDVALVLYREGFEPGPLPARVIVRDLVARCPQLAAFKQRHRDSALAHGRSPWPHPRLVDVHAIGGGEPRWRFKLWRRGYRWQAVRFAHKSFAIFDAAAATDADVLIWIDADTRFFADVTREQLEGFVPENCFVGCLRRRIHTECGFVAYNLRHAATGPMLREFERMYTEDVLFSLEEFHDSYLFDVLRRRAESRGHACHDIARGVGMQAKHVLVNSALGRFMDHMKGRRKDEGRSRARDLVVAREEAYWKGVQEP